MERFFTASFSVVVPPVLNYTARYLPVQTFSVKKSSFTNKVEKKERWILLQYKLFWFCWHCSVIQAGPSCREERKTDRQRAMTTGYPLPACPYWAQLVQIVWSSSDLGKALVLRNFSMQIQPISSDKTPPHVRASSTSLLPGSSDLLFTLPGSCFVFCSLYISLLVSKVKRNLQHKNNHEREGTSMWVETDNPRSILNAQKAAGLQGRPLLVTLIIPKPKPPWCLTDFYQIPPLNANFTDNRRSQM